MVRSGANYGFDFVLYAAAPGVAHAEYVVHAVTVEAGTSAAAGLSLLDLSALARASTAVAKELLVCAVPSRCIGPTDLPLTVDAHVTETVPVTVVKVSRWASELHNS